MLVATDHDITPDREMLWQEVQEQTAALSPKGRLKIVEGAGHFIQNDRPQVVIEAVLEATSNVLIEAAGVTERPHC